MKLKKQYTAITVGIACFVTTSISLGALVDGSFTANQNATTQGTITTNQLDLGWYSPISQTASVSGVYVTGRGYFNDQNYWIGQIFTDENATTGLQTVSFNVAYDEYSTKSVTGPQVHIEIFGSDTASTTSAFDLQDNSNPPMSSDYTQIGSRLIYDVSEGLGAYSQSLNFGGTGYEYIALRIGVYATGTDGVWGEDIGIDNFSIVAIPEPSTLAMVAVALGSLLIFRRWKF